MKGKINKRGNLEMERAGAFKISYCPKTIDGNICGDWCALFEEPVQVGPSKYSLSICEGKTLSFKKFTDARGKDA